MVQRVAANIQTNKAEYGASVQAKKQDTVEFMGRTFSKAHVQYAGLAAAGLATLGAAHYMGATKAVSDFVGSFFTKTEGQTTGEAKSFFSKMFTLDTYNPCSGAPGQVAANRTWGQFFCLTGVNASLAANAPVAANSSDPSAV